MNLALGLSIICQVICYKLIKNMNKISEYWSKDLEVSDSSETRLPPVWTKESDTKETKPSIFVDERRYFLNPSKSKYVSVALCYEFKFKPCVLLGGVKSDYILFNEKEWNELWNHKDIIMGVFYGNNDYYALSNIYTSRHIISFETYKGVQLVKISDGKSRILMAQETATKLFDMVRLVDYSLNVLKMQDFAKYFYALVEDARNFYGDKVEDIVKCAALEKNLITEKGRTLLEIVFQHPQIPELQCVGNSKYYNSNGSEQEKSYVR